MKHYYIKYYRAGNEYDLCYTTNSEQDERAASAGYERITRKQAEDRARAERQRRKDDPAFAYFAPALIFPFEVGKEFVGYSGDVDYERIADYAANAVKGWYMDGAYIVAHINTNV